MDVGAEASFFGISKNVNNKVASKEIVGNDILNHHLKPSKDTLRKMEFKL
jgi:hypothetical protein